MRRFLMMTVALCAVWTLFAETAFLECEAFEERGGWVNDTQFMDQMGSPYLLAHGLGKPVRFLAATTRARCASMDAANYEDDRKMAIMKGIAGSRDPGEVFRGHAGATEGGSRRELIFLV